VSLFGISRTSNGKWQVAVGWSIYVVPTLGDAIRFRLESL
jgi:hypothetical protein